MLTTKIGLSGSDLALGRYREARAVLDGAIDRVRRVFGERDFQTRVAIYNLACANANLGNVDSALGYLHESIERGWIYPAGPARDPLLRPLHGDPRFDVLERAGRWNDPASWSPAIFRADEDVRHGRYAEAERTLGNVIAGVRRAAGSRFDPMLWRAQRALAACWIQQRRFDEAERLLTAALTDARTERIPLHEPEALDPLVQCDLGRGRRDSALARIAEAAKSISREFGNVELLYSKAQIAAIRGDDSAALRQLAECSELGFTDAERLERDIAFVKLRPTAEFRAIARAARKRAL